MSQPWLDEAVGTAERTGTPLIVLLEEAGIRDGAVDVVFTGADHGIERGAGRAACPAGPTISWSWNLEGRPFTHDGEVVVRRTVHEAAAR